MGQMSPAGGRGVPIAAAPARRAVFLSHSCNGDPAHLPVGDPKRARLERAQAVRKAILARLAPGFEVWLDQDRIQPGDVWRLEIFRALHRCVAGVVLLDDDAFESPWVRLEAAILNFRRRLNPGFVLVPVLLDEGSSGRFDQGDWRPLALRELQALKATPAEVAEEVAARLGNLPELGDDPGLVQWVMDLAGHLRPLTTLHPDRLSRACVPLNIAPEDWGADHGSAIVPFAQALLSADDTVIATVANAHLRGALTQRETRQEIQRLLRPAWVGLPAAASTAAVLDDPADRRRALLNTHDKDVAAEYVDRAVSCAGGVTTAYYHGVFGEDDEEPGGRDDEIFAAVVREVLTRVPAGLDGSLTGPEFAAWLNRYRYRRVVLFLHAPLPAERLGRLLDRLADRFPGLAVLVLDGATAPTMPAAAQLRAVPIEPALDRGTELKAGFYRHELKEFVGG